MLPLYSSKPVFLSLLIALALLKSVHLCGQYQEAIKGASKFREIILESFKVEIQKIEGLKRKMDSLGISEQDFHTSCRHLYYVKRSIDKNISASTEYIYRVLINSEAYNAWDDNDLNLLLNNMDLISLSQLKLFDSRYPHRLNPASKTLKEIAHFGVEKGDKVLHYLARPTYLGALAYLSYDSIEVAYNSALKEFKPDRILDAIANGGKNPSSNLRYVFGQYPVTEKNILYDKIIFECAGMLFYARNDFLKRNFKNIYKILAAGGEVIISGNYDNPPFDGEFREIEEIEKKLKKVLKYGFEIKERIFKEGEFMVYKLKKKPK